MAPKKSMLERMRGNPKGDWGINDIQTACDQNGIELMSPTSGSHYKAASPHLAGHLTIPYKRPIKPVYIRSLVAMIDAHIEFEALALAGQIAETATSGNAQEGTE